jgi:hypothetical protein
LPYKSFDSLIERFKVDEDCVLVWMQGLNPSSKNYPYYFLLYREHFMQADIWKNAQALLDDWKHLDEEGRYKHLDAVKTYISSRHTGTFDKRGSWNAVRNFYLYHHCQLPRLTRAEAEKLFSISELDKKRGRELVPLQLQEVRQLILHAKMPYQAVFCIMLQAPMSVAEFRDFNRNQWQDVVKNLGKPGPIQVNMIRSKTSRGKVQKYYVFLSQDSKDLLSAWLRIRPKIDDPHCFLTYQKNDKKWVPVGDQIGATVTATARRAGLIGKGTDGAASRFHIHAHEVRDLFKSICSIRGVREIASEWFMGHSIDRLGYDKSPWYSSDFFLREYKKVEPVLNVISNPPSSGLGNEAIAASIKGEMLIAAGYGEQEVQKLDLTTMTSKQFQEMMRKKERQNLGLTLRVQQKVVALRDVEKMIEQGWEFVTEYSNGKKNGKKAIMRQLPAA